MICDPNDNSLNPPIFGPPPFVPGFGIPFGPLQIPFPDIQIPDGIPEDLIALVQQLLSQLPGGPLIPQIDGIFNNNLLAALASLFNQIAPYLALYRFLQPLLTMILCIIDVICALVFGAPRAARRLFKQCLPAFIALFPFLALLAMLLALLLLLLALIEFIIATILAYINDILANLLILAEAVQFQSAEDVVAGAAKIAYLLCLLENLFAILIALQTIFAIIEALAAIAGRSVCGRGSGRSGNDAFCCDEELCPDFISDNPDGVSGTLGAFVYYNQRNQNTSLLPVPIVVPPLRNESWQFFDQESGRTYNFSDIITPINGAIYWPVPLSYTVANPIRQVPYTLDFRFFVDPTTFGRPATTGNFSGPRFFRVRDAIVRSQPYIGVFDFANNLQQTNTTGTLPIIGGTVFEDDDTTPYSPGGTQLLFNEFITLPPAFNIPPVDDGYTITDIEYTLKPNHPYLVNEGLITLFCIPDLQTESAVFNSTFDITSVIDQIGALPNLNNAVACLQSALATLRQDVSSENLATFSGEVQACLGDLRTEAETAYTNTIIAGTSQFETETVLDPDVQFVDLPIEVKVTLRDAGGTLLSFGVPDNLAADIAAQIGAAPTLGQVGNFVFDGYESFVADLTSSVPGTGELTLTFNNNVISDILNRDDDFVATSIQVRTLPYEFVGVPVSAVDEDQTRVRRDETDVSSGGG